MWANTESGLRLMAASKTPTRAVSSAMRSWNIDYGVNRSRVESAKRGALGVLHEVHQVKRLLVGRFEP